MDKEVINPSTLQAPVGHFDRAVRMDNVLYVSGTSAMTNAGGGDMNNRKLVEGIEAQTRETWDNIKKVVDAAGFQMSDIFRVYMFITDRKYFKAVDEINKEYTPEKGFMASAFVCDLMHPEMLVEIEVTAMKD